MGRKRSPLSSAHLIPMTEATRRELMLRKVDLPPDAMRRLTEFGAQSLLALTDHELVAAPDCFGINYGDASHKRLCVGCAYKAHCELAMGEELTVRRTPPPAPRRRRKKKRRKAPQPPPRRER